MDAEKITAIVNLHNRVEADFQRVLAQCEAGDSRAQAAAADFIREYVGLERVLKQRIDDAYELSMEFVRKEIAEADAAS